MLCKLYLFRRLRRSLLESLDIDRGSHSVEMLRHFMERFHFCNSSLVRHLETGPGVVSLIVLDPCARSDNRTLRIVTSFVVGAIEVVEVNLFDLVSHAAHFKNVAQFHVVDLRSEQELTRMPPGSMS